MRVDLIKFVKSDKGELISVPACEEYVGLATILNEWNCVEGAEFMEEILQKWNSGGEAIAIQSEGDEYVVTIDKEQAVSERRDRNFGGDYFIIRALKFDVEDAIETIEAWCDYIIRGKEVY